MNSLKIGKYRHYKGNEYDVLSTARHSETEEYFVVYRTCYGDFSTWIRPLTMFQEDVLVDGVLVPRFTYIGSERLQSEKEPSQSSLISQSQTSCAVNDANDEVLQALNNSIIK